MAVGPVVISTYVRGIIKLNAAVSADLDYTRKLTTESTLLLETDPLSISIPERAHVTKDEKQLSPTVHTAGEAAV